MNEPAAPAVPAVPGGAFATAPEPPPQRLPIRFTGKGGEYFRIWIVNLLLTLVTVGIWSAWAKVRKTRYFWSNTQVGGAAFQYHGDPVAILRGRLLAGAFFVVYSVAGRIHVKAGMVAGAVLLLLGPWFFYKSMRFKLANTSWRGLRFGFDSSARQAYAVLAPAVVLGLVLVAAVASIQPSEPGAQPSPWPFVIAELALFACVPWLHARIKAYQHGRARFGSLAFQFPPSSGAFYALYGKTFLVSLPIGILMGAGVGVTVWLLKGASADPTAMARAMVPIFVVSYAGFLLGYLVAGAFFTSRLQRLVWTRTQAGPIRFSTTVTTGGFMRVWFVNALLTLLTAGLYWPWAHVAIARYQLDSMSVEAGAPLESVVAGSATPERSATGEGAVDFFGWDLGL